MCSGELARRRRGRVLERGLLAVPTLKRMPRGAALCQPWEQVPPRRQAGLATPAKGALTAAAPALAGSERSGVLSWLPVTLPSPGLLTCTSLTTGSPSLTSSTLTFSVA